MNKTLHQQCRRKVLSFARVVSLAYTWNLLETCKGTKILLNIGFFAEFSLSVPLYSFFFINLQDLERDFFVLKYKFNDKMISKGKIKYMHSLELKKKRDADNVFVAEGSKVVGDILRHHPTLLREIFATEEWLCAWQSCISEIPCVVNVVTSAELSKISFLCHPQHVVATFSKISTDETFDICGAGGLILVLDGVQDPGNLGTIIRVADWFGIEDIVCSLDTADVYNPKVVQATMGSIARVRVHYRQICPFLDALPPDVPVYGTLLEGHNMYEEKFDKSSGIIVMGNEGKGISDTVRKRITHALRIPSYPTNRETAESLNVAIATAVVCAEFRRK